MSIRFLTKISTQSFVFEFSKVTITCCVMLALVSIESYAQTRSAPAFGYRAVVVDERIAVLLEHPDLSARLLKRLSRGRKVSILNTRRSRDGIVFYRVAVTRRTRGWIQREAVVWPGRKGDDERLLNLIRASKDFDRIARSTIFLSTFSRSEFRPAVLLILGMAADEAAKKLSKDANNRLDDAEMKANRAATVSYFLSYSGLDRYRRLGVGFEFDGAKKEYHYDGATWREIVRRYPRSVEAIEARKRLDSLPSELSLRNR